MCTGFDIIPVVGYGAILGFTAIACALLRAWLKGPGGHSLLSYLSDMPNVRVRSHNRRLEPKIYAAIAGTVIVFGEVLVSLGYEVAGRALSITGFSGAAWSLFILPRRTMKQFWEEVRAAEFRVCPECHYSLRGLDSCGACPECGRPFEQSKLRQDWRRIMGEDESG